LVQEFFWAIEPSKQLALGNWMDVLVAWNKFWALEILHLLVSMDLKSDSQMSCLVKNNYGFLNSNSTHPCINDHIFMTCNCYLNTKWSKPSKVHVWKQAIEIIVT
jgi:hypothetical protein